MLLMLAVEKVESSLSTSVLVLQVLEEGFYEESESGSVVSV